MFGFFFGAACLAGLAVVAARGHRHHHHRGHWGRGYGRPWGIRGALYSVFSRLDATPAQEKVILGAVEELKDTVRGARGSLRQVRDAMASAVKGDAFDEASLGQAFSSQDSSFAEIRAAVTNAGRKIHEVLDERQRKTLADMIESGPFGFRGFGHSHGHC
jgi:hypothetical protein